MVSLSVVTTAPEEVRGLELVKPEGEVSVAEFTNEPDAEGLMEDSTV